MTGRIARPGAFAAALLCGAFWGPARAQTPIPPAPKDYAATAAQGTRYAALAARLALVEAQDPRVRSFAEAELRDELGDAARLREAVAASGLPVSPPGLSGDGAALLAGLQGLRGADFDRAYARQQVVAEAAALGVAESFAAAGAEPKLREAAQGALPALRDRLAAARRLEDALGGG